MNRSSILIVGATSAIAHQTARALLGQYSRFVLAGRNTERLSAVAEDLRARGAEAVHTISYDAEHDAEIDLVAHARQLLGATPDAVLIAHAVLPRHEEVIDQPTSARRVLLINAVSVLTLCTEVCRHFEQRGSGILAVISSVAADRGRMNNFLYAASKAALDVYLDGLRLRWKALFPQLRVLTIKPGYVRTPMTAHLDRMTAAVSAERVGSAIAKLITRRRSGRRYIPWWWRIIMGIVRRLPERFMLLIRQ